MAGVREFVIVVGYQFQMIENYLEENHGFGMNIQTVFNPEWHRGEESISAAIRELIRMKDMKAVFMNNEHWWIDIDTPEAYQFAQENLHWL